MKIIYSAGYTLLELMVVLAIMGIIMGLATPRLVKMYDAKQFSLEKDDIKFQLGKLASIAYATSTTINLKQAVTPGEQQLISLPDNWSISDSAEKISYSIYGFCNGGIIQLRKEDREITFELSPPFCQPTTPSL